MQQEGRSNVFFTASYWSTLNPSFIERHKKIHYLKIYFSLKKQVLREYLNLNFAYNHLIKDLNSYSCFRTDLLPFTYQKLEKLKLPIQYIYIFPI